MPGFFQALPASQFIHAMLRKLVWHANGTNWIMENTDKLQAELEELQRKYWKCFNNRDCDEDLEKIQCNIEELKYKLSLESGKTAKNLRKAI